ncbi:hypothetical protein R5R35_004971 [Gryllus longicercus]|uniref:Phosphoglucomutase-2 n=1 Tax=Gryllus longicercus TaxID=2509291 RepID=A0AAN9Z0L9_9ORTH
MSGKCRFGECNKSDLLREKIQEWLNWDKNENTRNEIQSLRDAGDEAQLQKLLLSRLQFGTAGLRGRMGPGYSQMNDLVIIQTAQGLCKYVEESFHDSEKKAGIVIGYDGRHNSKRFAELSAAIFLNRGISVYLFSKVCPTPFVPFAVDHFQCFCGVMVTASHNPKDDNGYKVYWDNGAQITSPHDKNIQKTILKNLEPWEKSWNVSIIHEQPLLVSDPLEEISAEYFGVFANNYLFLDINKSCSLKFTYTPMHGVGYPYMMRAFEAACFKPFVVVDKQRDPDPEFPTVKFPNPEEGKSALNLAFQTADSCNSTIILANDPDADRLAVAEKLENGEWRVFTGNELGALLGWWTLFCHKKRSTNVPLKDVYMLSSTVSSKILQSMSKVEGFTFLETLTGFKWMGNKAFELKARGLTVLFAFEEAIGFMCGTAVLDKDGISAGIQIAELAAYLAENKMSLVQKLEDIYKLYGQHLSLNSYFLCYDPDIIKHIFEKLSNAKGEPKTYPDSLMNGKYKITGVRDLRYGYDSNEPDLVPKLPVSSSSYMLTFRFGNGLVATLRTSGTEPKIKYYTELCSSPDEQNLDVLRSVLKEMVQAIIDEFLQPNVNGLIAPED